MNILYKTYIYLYNCIYSTIPLKHNVVDDDPTITKHHTMKQEKMYETFLNVLRFICFMYEYVFIHRYLYLFFCVFAWRIFFSSSLLLCVDFLLYVFSTKKSMERRVSFGQHAAGIHIYTYKQTSSDDSHIPVLEVCLF